MARIDEMFTDAFDDACENGDCKTARYIVDNYKPHLIDKSVLYWMYKCGQQDIVNDYLNDCDKHKRIIKGVIRKFQKDRNFSSVMRIIKSCNISIKDHKDLLYDAAIGGHLTTVKYFVENNADYCTPYRGDVVPIYHMKQYDINVKSIGDGKCLAGCVEDHLEYLKDQLKKNWCISFDEDILAQKAEIRNLKKVGKYLIELTATNYPERLI